MKTNRNYFLFNKENGKSLNLQLIDGQWFRVNRQTGEKSRLSEEELYDSIFEYGMLYIGSEQVKHRYRTVLNRKEAIYLLKHKPGRKLLDNNLNLYTFENRRILRNGKRLHMMPHCDYVVALSEEPLHRKLKSEDCQKQQAPKLGEQEQSIPEKQDAGFGEILNWVLPLAGLATLWYLINGNSNHNNRLYAQ